MKYTNCLAATSVVCGGGGDSLALTLFGLAAGKLPGPEKEWWIGILSGVGRLKGESVVLNESPGVPLVPLPPLNGESINHADGAVCGCMWRLRGETGWWWWFDPLDGGIRIACGRVGWWWWGGGEMGRGEEDEMDPRLCRWTLPPLLLFSTFERERDREWGLKFE